MIVSTWVALTTATSEIVGTLERLPTNASTATNSGRFGINTPPDRACLAAQKGGPDTCCGQCLSRWECAAYVWTDYEGGTCWLKTSIGVPTINIGAKACQVGADLDLLYGRWVNCDMPGNDLRNVQSPDEVKCQELCMGSRECKAVVWTDYQGGTCWLKTAVTKCTTYTGAIAAVVFNDETRQ